MDINLLAKRIKIARASQHLSLDDVANKIGVAKSTIQRYENAKISTPKIPVVHSIANALNVNPAWLVGKSDNMESTKFLHTSNSLSINVLGRVTAGIPIDTIEDIVDTEEIPIEISMGCKLFGLRIKGDSMSPRMLDGDTVIVRCQDNAETDEIVIALINGDDAVCKKLKKLENGIMLISTNPAYEPLVFTSGEIDSIPVRIIGKVIELRRKF